jgi:dipeptidyl aminopeptidase/acylaminoacyl peptidase
MTTLSSTRSDVNEPVATVDRIGRTLPEIPAEVHAADPVTYVNAATPPFLLLHGTRDVLISPSQTQRLHRALLAAGADSTRYLLRGANHGDMAIGDPEGGLPWSSTTTMGIITGYLHRHLDR